MISKTMQNISRISDKKEGISNYELKEFLVALLSNYKNLKKILLIPPDLTRMHSKAGVITSIFYNLLKDKYAVHILPALGTHDPMSKEECIKFFGPDIPADLILKHNWRTDVVNIGEIPDKFVESVSDGKLKFPVSVDINKILLDPSYDLIISIGQVVPHEVVGIANYSKNILVGCGGQEIINKSHFLGAVYGMEKIMGKDFSPVRNIFDYAQDKFLKDLPLLYVLTVTSISNNNLSLDGIFAGNSRKTFEDAVDLSREKNITKLDKKVKKVVVYLDPEEFKSTWLGNKAIYRTRMIIEDGGQLVILAPGVKKFGEDMEIDQLIKKYGYSGTENILQKTLENEDLKNNLSASAHLIHGSSDGRFKITYATKFMKRSEIEKVNYSFMDFNDALDDYNPDILEAGFNTLEDGEEVYYVDNPASGLWMVEVD